MVLLLKLLHIAAVVLFLGNVTTGLFWHAHAARTRDARILAHTMAGIVRSDRLFTLPSVVGVTVFGIALAIAIHLPILRTGWILWTIVLFSISGVVFSLRVAPLQRRLLELARAGEPPAPFDYEAYRAVARRWEAWGAVATLTPLAGMVLMVFKPQL